MYTLLPVLILSLSMQTWPFPSSLALRFSRAVHTQPYERWRKAEVRAREKQTRREKDNTRASDSKHVTQVSPDHHDQEKRAERNQQSPPDKAPRQEEGGGRSKNRAKKKARRDNIS